MSPSDLEQELARERAESPAGRVSNAQPLSVPEALAFRNAGNLLDEHGRTLRLVLHVADRSELSQLHTKRLQWEPDFHDAPDWRREGSRPVNVVPLRVGAIPPVEERAWWEESEVAALEAEWRATGGVVGLKIPEAYRGFLFKTILALRSAGKEITPTSVADSVARWVSPSDAAVIRRELARLNPSA